MWLLRGEADDTKVHEYGPWDRCTQQAITFATEHFSAHAVDEVQRLIAKNAPGGAFAVAMDKTRWISMAPEGDMSTIDHENREHATLSASGCDRWWNCPGSIRLVELLGTTSITTFYAAEGTAAHELAHMCLLNGQDSIEYIDREINGFTVNVEMAEAVQIYLDFCREIRASGADCFTEKKFSLKSLAPPVPMFGTADFVGVDRRIRRLTNVDFKYGKGVTVSIQNNPQLKYYGLGAMLAFTDVPFDTIETVIVQPRVSGPAIKRATYDAVDILGWSVDLIARAHETLKPDAPLVPGSWCRFCPASGQCPAQADKAFSIAQIEFADVIDPVRIADKEPIKDPPNVTKLTPQQIGIMLGQADILEDFIKTLRAAAQHLIEHGEVIPGWKVAPKRATRRWKDEEGTPFALEITGVPEEKIWTKKLISPAQAEIALAAAYRETRHLKGEASKDQAKLDLKDLITATSSGGTLAPDSDVRPSLPGRGTEFDFEQLPAIASE